MPVGGLALLALPALTSRTVETTGRNTACNLDLAFWHADSREFEGEATRVVWARAVRGPLIVEESARQLWAISNRCFKLPSSAVVVSHFHSDHFGSFERNGRDRLQERADLRIFQATSGLGVSCSDGAGTSADAGRWRPGRRARVATVRRRGSRTPSRVRRHTIPKSRRRSADARGAPGAASPRLCSAPRATTTDRLVQVARSVALSSRRIIVVVLAACVLVAGIVAFRLNRQVDRALDAAVSISLARIDDNVSADHVSPLKKPPRDGKRPRTVKLVNTNGTLISSVHERYARRLGKQGQRQ